ncbi:MAG: hypothetical protein ACYC1D_14025 [Acidimicrobiales bacterium]
MPPLLAEEDVLEVPLDAELPEDPQALTSDAMATTPTAATQGRVLR